MLKNPLLKQAQTKIESGVQDRDAYNRIVQAGTKVIYDKATFTELSKAIRQAQDPVTEIAEGMIGILGILYKQSRKTMPIPAMVTAGMSLLLDALDFAEQAGLVKIDKAQLNKATTHYLNSLLPKFGLTPDKIDATLGQLGGTIKDPAKMAQIQGGK
jgi:hypothetical protein